MESRFCYTTLKSVLGTVSSTIKAILPGAPILLIFAVMFIPVTISFGGDTVTLTVKNSTPDFLHAIIDGEPYLYIKPGLGVVHEAEGYVTLHVQVFYAPGQGISGSVERDMTLSPYKPESTGCSDNSSGGGGCECTTNPATGGARTWEITPEAFTSDTLQTSQRLSERGVC
jgi:hypothetical protein